MPEITRKTEIKSAERFAFEFYLRTGRRIAQPEAPERKFNPYHDPRTGQFTFAPGGPRSIANPIFSDRRGLRRPKSSPSVIEQVASDDATQSRPRTLGVVHAVLTSEPSGALQQANLRPNPRAQMGGNGGPPLHDPMVIGQVFPTLHEAAAGSIVAIGDNLLDITGPARTLAADLHRAEVRKLVSQIQAIDPNYRFESLGPPRTIEGMGKEIKDLRFDRAVAFYRANGEMRPLQVELLRTMQDRANSAYNEGVALYEAGRLKPRLSREEAIGNYVDRAVRRTLRQRLDLSLIDYSAGQPVRLLDGNMIHPVRIELFAFPTRE